MGVRGLQTYCTVNCSDVCERVNIEHLSHQYHNKTGRTPTIVVDGPSCLRRIYGDNSWVCGGQFKQFVENCCAFVDRFHNAGIKLVFFFDGPTVNQKRETWIERRKRSICDIEKIFDSLVQKDFREESFTYQQPLGLNTFARFIFKHICLCEVYASVRECDAEIADYARNNYCFAVMGQDSDFIIFNSAPYYFSANDLDLSKLETINYNTKALADNLQLTVLHLPLFASLMGNDVIPVEKLRNFHTRYCPRRTESKFANIAHGIADYIRNFPPVGNGLYGHLEKICRFVFNDAGMSSILHQSIQSYLPEINNEDETTGSYSSSDWEQILKQVTSKHRSNEIPSCIYGVVRQMPFESSTYMEDFRKTDLPYSGIISRPSRQRLYSIMLSECPHADVIEEWCVTGKNSLDRPHIVPVMKSSIMAVRHSGLQSLWDEQNRCEAVIAERWALMAWIISPKLPVSRLRWLPPHLVVPAAALFFMIHEVQPVFLRQEELELLIVVSVTLQTYDTMRLSQIVIRRPNIRAVRLTTLYLRLLVHIFNVNGGCGFPVPPQECLPSNYFDGKLFQDLYYKMNRGLPLQQELRNKYQQEQFWNMRNLILGD